MTTRTPKQKHPGFALVIALITLAVALAAFAALAQLSLSQLARSRAAETALQKKWLVYSAQKVLLPRAHEALAASLPAVGRQASDWSWQTTLPTGGVLHLSLQDEQSKINLNTRFLSLAGSDARALTLRLLQQTRSTIPLTWSPSLTALQSPLASSGQMPSGLAIPPFSAWPQVLSLPAPPNPTEPPFPPITSLLTLYGGGKINFKSAPDLVLIESLSSILPPAQLTGFLDLRARFPGMSFDAIADQLKFSDQSKTAASQLLTDRSQTFSLWIHLQDSTNTSTQTTLWTQEYLENGQTLITRSDW